MSPKSNKFPPILTVEQAAQFMQLERHTIYELIRQGRIPAFRAGRAIRLSRDKLLEIVGEDGMRADMRVE